MFEAVHGGEFIEGGLHHPNQYYEQSRKVLNPKTNEDRDGKEKQAVPTPPQQKEEQTAAAAAPKVVAAWGENDRSHMKREKDASRERLYF